MDDELYKKLDLKDFLKDSQLLIPLKEYYPAYLAQQLDKTLDHWNNKEFEKAKEQIAIFNSNFKHFQIGKLFELIINFNDIDAEKTIAYLNTIPENQRNEVSIGLTYHFVKACLYFSLWDIDEARQECNNILKFDKNSAPAYYLRGTCFALRSRHHSAIADFKKALKDNYNREEITANLAYSYLRIQEHWKALRLHKRIVDKFPKNDKIQYNTGICFKRFKNYKKAIFYFNKAIDLSPDNPGYKLTRGRVLMRLKKHKLAHIDLQFAYDSGLEIAGQLLRINTEVLEGKLSSRNANKRILELLKRK
jgi:tetratricopeptide (TPR) repeat protein